MIYVTGDTHGFKDFFKLLAPELSALTKDDYVIICGDIGVLFDEKNAEHSKNLYSYLPFTVLFVDGNHENFDLINSYPIQEWNGGKIHKITPSVYHLMRGQVFQIEGKSFFTFGGALSFDKRHRTEGKSWWKAEMPEERDYEEGVKNLEKVGFKADYVLTHDCPTHLMKEVAFFSQKLQHEGIIISKSNEYLEEFSKKIEFSHWYFAHYHLDAHFGERYDCLFNNIKKLV